MTDIEHVRPGAVDGMEDIGATDLVLPILKINHDKNGFEDSLTNEVHSKLQVITLGVVKQRILWPADPGAAGEGPICRSYDFTSGIPDPEKFMSIVEKPKGHPTGFDRGLIEAHGPLACSDCPLKDWGTHPRGDKPWCDEQWTVPLLILGEDGSYSPALISFQRTGVKPIKNYVTAFHARKMPLYTSITTLEAQQQLKGTNPYTVPKFTKGDSSDPTLWPEFSSTLAAIRAFITTPRARREDDETPVAPRAAATAAAPTPATATAAEVTEDVRPAHRAAPVVSDAPAPAEDSDEVPF